MRVFVCARVCVSVCKGVCECVCVSVCVVMASDRLLYMMSTAFDCSENHLHSAMLELYCQLSHSFPGGVVEV